MSLTSIGASESTEDDPITVVMLGVGYDLDRLRSEHVNDGTGLYRACGDPQTVEVETITDERVGDLVLLNPVESRFPLTRGRTTAAVTTAETGDAEQLRESQRFGLRFFVRDAAPPAVPAFTYCQVRQVTVDDHDVPIVHGPFAGWSQTSTGNMDGNEETKMDQDPDSN